VKMFKKEEFGRTQAHRVVIVSDWVHLWVDKKGIPILPNNI